jgi:hypothetical protein
MTLTGKSLIVLLSVGLCFAPAALAVDQEKPKFTIGPVTSYECRQTISGVTIATQPFRTKAETEPAFGKLDFNRLGVLPVLVVIQNDSKQTIALSLIKAEIVAPDRQRVEATPPGDLKYVSGPDRPMLYPTPIPGKTIPIPSKKSPFKEWQIEARAFTARMLPPGESAGGFFYFRAFWRSGSTLYLTGLREAATGKELFYFEVPLEK